MCAWGAALGVRLWFVDPAPEARGAPRDGRSNRRRAIRRSQIRLRAGGQSFHSVATVQKAHIGILVVRPIKGTGSMCRCPERPDCGMLATQQPRTGATPATSCAARAEYAQSMRRASRPRSAMSQQRLATGHWQLAGVRHRRVPAPPLVSAPVGWGCDRIRDISSAPSSPRRLMYARRCGLGRADPRQSHSNCRRRRDSTWLVARYGHTGVPVASTARRVRWAQRQGGSLPARMQASRAARSGLHHLARRAAMPARDTRLSVGRPSPGAIQARGGPAGLTGRVLCACGGLGCY